jgi:hypothetical protein
MKQSPLISLRRAVKIGIIIGIVMILGTGLAILREFHKSAAADAEIAQMQIQVQQRKAQHHHAGPPAAPPGAKLATPPSPAPAKPSAPH